MRANQAYLRREALARAGRCGAGGELVGLSVSVREAGDIRIVDARGCATLGEGSDRLQRELQNVIRTGWRKIVVNLAEVEQIDSAGIGVLVRNCTALARANGTLKLVCPAGRVRDALKVTRLVESIPTFDAEALALASFR